MSSNREAGEGRFDIQLVPKKKGLPGILVELKSTKNCLPERLSELAEEALIRMELRKYHEEMNRQGVNEVVKYGVAFCSKKVKIATITICTKN